MPVCLLMHGRPPLIILEGILLFVINTNVHSSFIQIIERFHPPSQHFRPTIHKHTLYPTPFYPFLAIMKFIISAILLSLAVATSAAITPLKHLRRQDSTEGTWYKLSR
jgi:hypothetical protein